jgi:hypothetical protein
MNLQQPRLEEVARSQVNELVTLKALLNSVRVTLTLCEVKGMADQDQIDRLLLISERRLDDIIFEFDLVAPRIGG